MKRITVNVSDDLHFNFKNKVTSERLQMTDVVIQLIEDYLAGRIKMQPKPRDRQKRDKKGA